MTEPAGEPGFMRHPLLRGVLGAAAGLALVAVAVTYLGISRRGFLEEIQAARPGPLLFAVAAGFVLLGFQSLRWWTVMRPVLPGLRYLHAYQAMLVGFFFNALIPARGGDLLRVQYLGRRTGVSRAKLLGTEIVDFWSDKWGWVSAFPALCLVAFLLPPHESPPGWLFRALVFLAGIIAATGLVLVLLATGRLWRRNGQPWGPAWLERIREGLAAPHWKRLLVVETVLAPLPWLWEVVVIVVAARALDLELTPMQAFAALTAWNIGTVVPSPGNTGSFEATGTWALHAAGVPDTKALALIFLYHLSQVLPGMAAAAMLLVFQGEKLFGRQSVFRTLGGSPLAVVTSAE